MCIMRVQAEMDRYSKVCEDAFEESKKQTGVNNKQWLDSPWNGFFTHRDPMKLDPTGVSVDSVDHILHVFSSEPGADFNIHTGIIGHCSVSGQCWYSQRDGQAELTGSVLYLLAALHIARVCPLLHQHPTSHESLKCGLEICRCIC